jgi:alkyldihydroxyacetonephosphate synthase
MAEQAAAMSWSGWGDPNHRVELSESVLALLRNGLGVRRENPPPGSIDEVPLTRSRLSPEVARALAEVVDEPHLLTDHATRVRHAVGRSTFDLLALRSGQPLPAPDAVLMPEDHAQVLAVLERCSEHRVAVVPFGGGTSVVGGLTPDADAFAGLVALDLRRLDSLLVIDSDSRLAELQPGLRGPEAERHLAERGFTIGHFPQSFEYATLGGFAAARSSGQASAGYGRFDDLVARLRVATPRGSLELGRAPRSAAGPDLRQLVLGSEGAFGVITSLQVRIRPAPERRGYEGWRFASFADGMRTLRGLAQDGPLPTVLRLSDEAETAMNLARPDQVGQAQEPGCLAITGYEGGAPEVERLREATSDVLRRAGATPVPEAGEGWAAGRYHGPYLRDALIDAGALVETLETAAFWSRLPELYRATAEALRETLSSLGTPPVVLCHISHVYATGASLYFTIACAQSDDPTAQWRQAKDAASQAILAAGGTISHHHGVGRDHREWLRQEVGELGVGVLAAVKRELDPEGILNPGVLIE